MEYKSTIKSRPFLFKETKKAAALINQGFSLNDIKVQAVEQNIFQLESEGRKKEVASGIIDRLKGLDGYIIEKITESTIETAKLLVLYAIIKRDRLFFEFMNEVYKEKLLLRDSFIRDKDFSNFFQSKREQSERVASWQEYTFKKIKQVYVRILFECGLIENQKGDRKIKVPILESAVKEHLYKAGDKIYVNAILGDKE